MLRILNKARSRAGDGLSGTGRGDTPPRASRIDRFGGGQPSSAMGPPATQPVAVASVTAGGSSGGGSRGARGSSGGPPPAGGGGASRSRSVINRGPFGRPPSRDAQM
eukprot:12406213-Karenia_brevis.AAC.1